MANRLDPQAQWPHTCPLGIELAMAADTQFTMMWKSKSWKRREVYRADFHEADLVAQTHALHCAGCLFSPLRPRSPRVGRVVDPGRLEGVELDPVIRAALTRLQGVVVECVTAPPRGRPRRIGRASGGDGDHPVRGAGGRDADQPAMKPRRKRDARLDRVPGGVGGDAASAGGAGDGLVGRPRRLHPERRAHRRGYGRADADR